MISMEVIFTDNSSEAASLMGGAVITALTKCALLAQGYAADLCPVDTGRLRNSITYQIDSSEKAAYIGTNTSYASYVENGTSKMSAQPYLKPAVTNHTSEYQDIIKSYMKNA